MIAFFAFLIVFFAFFIIFLIFLIFFFCFFFPFFFFEGAFLFSFAFSAAGFLATPVFTGELGDVLVPEPALLEEVFAVVELLSRFVAFLMIADAFVTLNPGVSAPESRH
ncbi:MAG: hypothetical protein HOG95_10335 [Rhodospirillaceae bacterium]|nr:hypothetical protein [Rhodospirillaceae bacterium]MBT5940318.1 hypothetical protein [Rhodospirillaceae bacterium]MBT7267871.1 hypothetical protein [Rhodospirillaceae bacterium]